MENTFDKEKNLDSVDEILRTSTRERLICFSPSSSTVVQTMSGVCMDGRGGPTSEDEHRGGYAYKYKSAQSAITVIARASVG